MSKNDELVLTTTRAQLEAHGAFQGYLHGTELLDEILAGKNWGFRRRGDVEDDPSFKQLIPYCVIVQGGKILVYERGKSGGEQKLHAKLSLGIGGHINPEDSGEALSGAEQLHRALVRELDEEVTLPAQRSIRYAGLINDDRDPVGQVHFGVVAIVDVGPGEIKPNENAISNPQMVDETELETLHDRLEGWSRLVAENLGPILKKP